MPPTRAFSPPSTSHASTTGGNAPRNIVNKLVLEGSAKDAAEPAVIRLFAKICIPEFPPNQTYPLFAEGPTRLLHSVCHPLNPDGIPYALPPNAPRLLKRAIRALNLPNPSTEAYPDILAPVPSSSNVKSPGLKEITTAMTGEIIVNDFKYCYLSPRILVPPASFIPQSTSGTVRNRRRRSSIGASLRDGPLSYHVLAMELAVPLVSSPPRSPYMINMALPRCLHNNMKFQVFPPPSSRRSRSQHSDFSSAASSNTSSDDEHWEVRTDPPLLASSRPRGNSTASTDGWASDEDGSSSSDSASSTGRKATGSSSSKGSSVSGGEIRGAFPSSERLIIRWSQATSGRPIGASRRAGEARKKLSVRQVLSTMECTIGKPILDTASTPSLPVDIVFNATCVDLSHPGVETALGLDVTLDTFGSAVNWAEDPVNGDFGFDITGDNAAKGWSWAQSAGAPTAHPLDDNQHPSTFANRMASSTSNGLPSPRTKYNMTRSLSSVSVASSGKGPNGHGIHSASLLRAPLPGSQAAEVPDYSFESPQDPKDDDDTFSLTDGYLTNISSRRSSMNSQAPDLNASVLRHPSDPFVVHVDLIPLLPTSATSPPMQIKFTVRARLILSGSALDPNHLALPAIRIPMADSHTCNIFVKTESRGELVEISAPEEGRRENISVSSQGAAWDVQIAQQPWNEALSSISGDAFGDDCLLVVLPTPGKRRARVLDSASTRATMTPLAALHDGLSSTATPSRPTPNKSIPAPKFDPVTPARRSPLPSFDLYSTPLEMTPTNRAPVISENKTAIPWVEVTISPVPPLAGSKDAWSHAVRLRAPWPSAPARNGKQFAAPSYSEFGFVKAEKSEPSFDAQVYDASVEGVRAEFQIYPGVESSELAGLVLGNKSEADPGLLDWASWVRVEAPFVDVSGVIEVLYTMKSESRDKRQHSALHVALPVFPFPVSRLTVTVDDIADFDIQPVSSNFSVTMKSPPRFVHYSLSPYFVPQLSIAASSARKPPYLNLSKLGSFIFSCAVIFILSALAFQVQQLQERVDIISDLTATYQQRDIPIEPVRPTLSLAPPPTTTTPIADEEYSQPRRRSTFPNPEDADDTSTYIPSIPFDDSAFDDLPNMVRIPVTPTYTPQSTPTEVSLSAVSSSRSSSSSTNFAFGALVDPRRNRFAYLLDLTPAELLRKAWEMLIMIFHYPMTPP